MIMIVVAMEAVTGIAMPATDRARTVTVEDVADRYRGWHDSDPPSLPIELLTGDQEGAAFDEQQSQADDHDQRIADHLDDMDGPSDRLCRRLEKNGSDSDDDDGCDGLNSG